MKLGDLEGIGPVRLEALRAVGISSLRDLLFTLPVGYEDHCTISPCSVRQPGNIFRELFGCLRRGSRSFDWRNSG